ncbi:hypothetical protein A3A46_02990 [Candidatus Roizmanbacteria bacterium RIFCSPLOWO2_01_FULL_37_13]|nr:MAG: hypothetical protein A3A46_02990 [Candidatus Roizmanbacteria bacterium RIFCSPLOWO2_01_FULL_37_13]
MSKTFDYYIETPTEENSEIVDFLNAHWGSKYIVSRGKKVNVALLPHVMARDRDRKLIGLATYQLNKQKKTCELVSINAVIQGQGIGSELLKRAEREAKKSGCEKIWLITINDNSEAAAFYIKLGYRLVKVHLNALDISRKLKPEIPKIGNHGIPLLDEWEFEKTIK